MVSSRKLLIISVMIFLLWVGIGIFMYTSPSFKLASDEHNPFITEEIQNCKRHGQKLNPSFWKKVDLQKNIPESINKTISHIEVHSNFITYQGVKIHYLYAVNPKIDMKKDLSILLLHGQAYKAENWKKLQTIQNIAAIGFFAVALDLPGYGKSAKVENINKVEFLNFVISTLNLKNVVVVSPSFSGAYSLEFLLQHPEKLAGFIPISPTDTSILEESPCKNVDNVYKSPLSEGCERIKGYLKKQPPDLSCIKVPTLIVFGERDRGENSAKLCFLPNSQGVEIPGGQHAAYKSNPILWHKLLYNFLSVINETLECK